MFFNLVVSGQIGLRGIGGWRRMDSVLSQQTVAAVDPSDAARGRRTAIFNDSSLKVNEINVETFKGVARLSRFVRSQADIDKAVEVARGVAGVKSVKNDMRLK